MATELSLLVPDFRQQVVELTKACLNRGTILDVISTVIHPIDQAALWKQGRSATDAELKTLALINAKANYLASCMRTAKALETNRVTDDLPGCSWAQWGESAIFVWIDSRCKLNFSVDYIDPRINANGYRTLAEEAKKLGLTSCSAFASSYVAWATVQKRQENHPTDLFSITEIDLEMRRRYGQESSE